MYEANVYCVYVYTVHTLIYTNTNKHTHACMRTNTEIDRHKYRYTCMHMNTHVYTQTLTYTDGLTDGQTDTHIHTYIHRHSYTGKPQRHTQTQADTCM